MKRLSICFAILVTAASICGAAVGQITSYVQINPPGGKQAGGFNVGRSTATAICFDDGSCLMSTGGTGEPGGSATQLQYNNSGAFGGISGTSVSGSQVNFSTVTASSGTITTLNVRSIKFSNGTIQVSSPTASGGSGGVGGTFAAWYLTDTNNIHWQITDSITGHLTSATVTSIPSGSLAPNHLVTQDASFNLWTITIDTGGHLVTTLAGTTAQSITDLLMNDSSNITWVNTVDTGGHLVTQ